MIAVDIVTNMMYLKLGMIKKPRLENYRDIRGLWGQEKVMQLGWGKKINEHKDQIKMKQNIHLTSWTGQSRKMKS